MNTYKHFKLYKSGKNWCVMAIATLATTIGLTGIVSADTNVVNNTTVTTTEVQPATDAGTNKAEATTNTAEITKVDPNNLVSVQPNQQQLSVASGVSSDKSNQPVQPQAEEKKVAKNGWVQEDKGWTYYTNGSISKGWAYTYLPTVTAKGVGTGSNWYLTNDGVVQSGVQQWAGTYYDFDPTTYLRVDNNYVQSQWGDWYLFGNDGRIQTKVQKWAGTYYYFDPVTYLRVDNDYRQSQWGDWYLFGNDGRIQTKVQQWAGTYYYFDPSTYLRVDNDYRQSQWGDWYMLGGDGRIVSGFVNWYGSLYFFNPTTYLKLTNTYFNGNGYWNNWDTYWADNNGVVHGVHYFSQFTPVWAGWGCAGASLTMLLSIHNIWPGIGTVIAGTPQGGNGGQIGNPYNGAGFSRVIQPNALAAYGRRWYGGVSDSSGATISQIVSTVLNGHPVLYYGYSPYDAGGVRNHCKIILGYNRNNGLFHVYDPCYGNGGWGAYSEGRSAYDRGWNSWITWNQLASEYAGQALTIY